MAVPMEFYAKPFVDAVKAAEVTVGVSELGYTPQSEFHLYLQTGSKILNLRTLQERAKNNDLKDSKIRSVYWKIFLGLLPLNTEKWKDHLMKKRNEYDRLYSQHLDSLPEEEDEADLNIDNPLSNAVGTKWDAFFQDTELKEMIDLDIQRTYPEHDFFIHKWVQKKLINVLFIFCKENPKLSYRQGMNELIAPIFMLNVMQSTIQSVLESNRNKNQQNKKNKSKSSPKKKRKKNSNNIGDEFDPLGLASNGTDNRKNSNSDSSLKSDDIEDLFNSSNDNDGNNANNANNGNNANSDDTNGHIDNSSNDNNNSNSNNDSNDKNENNIDSNDNNSVENSNNNENNNNNNNNNNDSNENEFDSDSKSNELWSIIQDINFVEHDSYFMFCEIMNHMGKYFTHNEKSLGPPPIIDRCHRIQSEYLRQVDPSLGGHLKKVNIEPQLYGLRWIRLFFCREFHMRDAMLIWDSIFSVYSENKAHLNELKVKAKKSPRLADDSLYSSKSNQLTDFRFVDYFGVAMLMYIRHQLIDRDNQHCLRRVMKYPPVEDVGQIIEKAYTVRDRIERKPKARKTNSKGRNSYNFSDRWNRFSHTISKAMNNYADDVKKIMTKDDTFLKKRLKFEHALGEKMGEILERIQVAIHNEREEAPASSAANGSIKSENDSKIDSNDPNNEINNDSNENESKTNETVDPLAAVVAENPLIDFDDDLPPKSNSSKKSNKNKEEHATLHYKIQSSSSNSKRSSLLSNVNSNVSNANSGNSVLVIEEALAELKLVKDALLGNLDETQLEAWLDWSFIEVEDEPPLYGTGLPPVKHRNPKDRDRDSPNAQNSNSSHRRNISSSGLLPPQQAMRAAQSTSALKKVKTPVMGPL